MSHHDYRGHVDEDRRYPANMPDLSTPQPSKEQTFSVKEVLAITKQAWWAGFNTSGEGYNAEHCQASVQDLKTSCLKDITALLQGTLEEQIPA